MPGPGGVAILTEARDDLPVNAIAFDTLGIARDLEAAGVERRQAEAHAEALRKATAFRLEHLATKADLAPLATKAELAALETRLTQRMYTVVFAAVLANGVISGALAAALRVL